MGLFSQPPPPDNKNQPSQAAQPKRPDIFERSWWAGRLAMRDLNYHIDRMPGFPDWEKEYIKRVVEKFDEPHYSRGITKEEFLKALDEMVRNPRDPIDPQEADRIRQYFEKI